MKGILLVDKPAGVTSHDVVSHIRRAAGMRRIGHTGTLDPAATGLLILCLGPATRLSEFITGMDKTYVGAMRLGVVTDSHDMDGQAQSVQPVPEFDEETIRAAFERFTGRIMQIPPMVSAIKVGGERLYKIARRGDTVERSPRPVTIYEFTLQRVSLPDVHFEARCSRGAYVRTLCHDVGESLGCGGALLELRRTRVGPHSVEDARPMADFQTREDVESHLLGIEDVLTLPQAVVRTRCRKAVTEGRSLGQADLCEPCPISEGWLQLKSETGELLAVAEVEEKPALRIHPKRVLTSGVSGKHR